MPSCEVPSAASVLAAAVLDGPEVELTERARTRVSVHYETGLAELPVLCVCTPEAVRLPNAVVTRVLPSSVLVAGSGALRAADGSRRWRVTRWWRPPAPRGLGVPAAGVLPSPVPPAEESVDWAGLAASYDGLDPARLVGAGPGLTPAGDDILSAALVTAHATADPRLAAWRRRTEAALTRHATTVVSRGMLHAALDGYAAPELAACIEAACAGRDLDRALGALLTLGHSSGAALWHGVAHTLTTRTMRSAA